MPAAVGGGVSRRLEEVREISDDADVNTAGSAAREGSGSAGAFLSNSVLKTGRRNCLAEVALEGRAEVGQEPRDLRFPG